MTNNNFLLMWSAEKKRKMKNNKFTLDNHITIDPALIVFGEIAGFIRDWNCSGVQIDIGKASSFGSDCIEIKVVSEHTENENLNRGFISAMNESIQNNLEGKDNIVTFWHGDSEAVFFVKGFFDGQHKPMDKEFVLDVLEEVRNQQLTEPQITLA